VTTSCQPPPRPLRLYLNPNPTHLNPSTMRLSLSPLLALLSLLSLAAAQVLLTSTIECVRRPARRAVCGAAPASRASAAQRLGSRTDVSPLLLLHPS
jgi:hypothetical protein